MEKQISAIPVKLESLPLPRDFPDLSQSSNISRGYANNQEQRDKHKHSLKYVGYQHSFNAAYTRVKGTYEANNNDASSLRDSCGRFQG